MKNSRRALLRGTLLIAVVGAGSYAFTAANTVPTTKAGDGSGAVTGYTVSDVHYTLDASNPDKVDTVQFSLNSAPAAGSTASIHVDGAWYSACVITLSAVDCDTASAPDVADIATLRVVVAD